MPPATPPTDSDWKALITTTLQQLQSTTTTTSFPTYPLPAHPSLTIDHTQLSPTASPTQIDTLCTEAQRHHFATVCVRLPYVARAVQNLSGSSSGSSSPQTTPDKPAPTPGIACVISFPHGTDPTASKTHEAASAVAAGATELDMVLNRPLLQAGEYTAVYADIRAVRTAIPADVVLKVILETGRLAGTEEVVAGSVVACLAGADYIKTSTGLDGPGARVEDVRVMRWVAGKMGTGTRVKASGGVRGAEDWRAMVEAGAERVGSSSGVGIVVQLAGNKEGKEGEGDGEEEGGY
ncbi:2-deoxyribose-5-phosphate aldolase [Aspergillus brunneoviolaceus CBS 621.78]|uniref:Deoxyribose-phosphate aldolase n=1 Tax=Aspergillus brunneoviolaceus CBS 621.78 TaxID=1450534 RepID=A0ACD1FUR9_9EURO|nr:deoxyribose-phosphate aldolase [Aspergillus brunneoviolaceus CBS 621.78]RAH40753.1 deoxyribose-phosphate aldolase [Aspergillus brunneoviolaceus CBS 621.78]